ncbi:uncharacterized protein LOC142974211 [Anticarsia gemmatalis]|uniref:uncharacterized protein LOC142974211 n=1 Tax=Anticarsia gemmatalis TaxID=129554 RepID=UPI003F76EF30
MRVDYINNLLRPRAAVFEKSPLKTVDNLKISSLANYGEICNDIPSFEVVCGVHCILDVMLDFTKLFQFPIFSFTCQMLAWNLIAIQNLVISMKEQTTVDISLIMCVTPILMFMMVIMLAMCYKAQTLSTKMEKTRKLCIDLMSIHNEGKPRKQAKQIILMVEGRSSVSIYNIFTLGTRLPLHLLAITASYTIALKKEKNIEYLSKDILDEEFIKSFRPMYRFQLLIASCRVNVKHWFVTSPSFFQRCHTILSIIGILGLDYLTIMKYSLIMLDNSTIYNLSTCVTALQTLTFFCNVIHVRFVNGDENAEFFVKLQQIDRCMKLDRNKALAAMTYRGNVFSITWVMAIFSCLLAASSIKHNISFLALLGIVYTQVNFVIEIVSCSNIFTHFYIRTRFINSILFNYINNTKVDYISTSKRNAFASIFPTKKVLRQLAAESHSFTSSETDVYMKEILDGFSKFQAIYKFQIFVFSCKLVASSLLTFEFVLFAAQNENADLTDSLTPAVFTLIDIVVALILVVRCELFLREVKGTKRLAIKVMSLHFEGRLRDKSKRMLKLIEETPPRLSVYEMWELDANVLLQMFMLVTSLILTQLQFVFL